MEICEDMQVDLEFNIQKRHCMDEINEHPKNKRICNGLQSIANGNGILLDHLNDCSVAYWQMQMLANKGCVPGLVQKPEIELNRVPFKNPERGPSCHPCQRCVAGESGHINHILGL